MRWFRTWRIRRRIRKLFRELGMEPEQWQVVFTGDVVMSEVTYHEECAKFGDYYVKNWSEPH